MHVFVQIPSGSQPIRSFAIRRKFPAGNFLPMLNLWKIYNPSDKNTLQMLMTIIVVLNISIFVVIAHIHTAILTAVLLV